MRKTKEEAEVTRENLLDAALTVFSQRGYAKTTLKDIATQAGVTRGAIYWHFGGKMELYGALVNERFTQVNSVLAEVFRDDSTPYDKLRKLLLLTMKYVEENEQYRAILELTLFKTEVIEEMGEMMKDKKTANNQYIEEYAKIIQKGIELGQFRSDLDVRAAAIAAVSLTGGVISLWLTSPDIFNLSKTAEAIVDTFLQGLRK